MDSGSNSGAGVSPNEQPVETQPRTGQVSELREQQPHAVSDTITSAAVEHLRHAVGSRIGRRKVIGPLPRARALPPAVESSDLSVPAPPGPLDPPTTALIRRTAANGPRRGLSTRARANLPGELVGLRPTRSRLPLTSCANPWRPAASSSRARPTAPQPSAGMLQRAQGPTSP
jgi:hypothetical protein